MSERPFRLLPRVTERNRHFWQGGEHGELRFLRCEPCGTWVHPPQPVCPDCLGKRLAPGTRIKAAGHTITIRAGRAPKVR